LTYLFYPHASYCALCSLPYPSANFLSAFHRLFSWTPLWGFVPKDAPPVLLKFPLFYFCRQAMRLLFFFKGFCSFSLTSHSPSRLRTTLFAFWAGPARRLLLPFVYPKKMLEKFSLRLFPQIPPVPKETQPGGTTPV